jgi:hypothetical protein
MMQSDMARFWTGMPSGALDEQRSGQIKACSMLDILNLALPFFGLIFIGFACGKLRQIPDAGLAWMNFFILYVSLPALFFRILSKTPVRAAGADRLRQGDGDRRPRGRSSCRSASA